MLPTASGPLHGPVVPGVGLFAPFSAVVRSQLLYAGGSTPGSP